MYTLKFLCEFQLDKKLLEQINKFIKVATFKIQDIKNRLHLYPPIMNNPKIKLRKQLYLLQYRNYKILKSKSNKRGIKLICWKLQNFIEKIKVNLGKWKDNHVHESENLILLLWQYSPKWSKNFTQFLSKSQLACEKWQADLKIPIQIQRTQNGQINPEEQQS